MLIRRAPSPLTELSVRAVWSVSELDEAGVPLGELPVIQVRELAAALRRLDPVPDVLESRSRKKSGVPWGTPKRSAAAGAAAGLRQKVWRMPSCTPCELLPGLSAELAPSTLKSLVDSLSMAE